MVQLCHQVFSGAEGPAQAGRRLALRPRKAGLPLSALQPVCRGPESDWRRLPLQGSALPLSYLGRLTVSINYFLNSYTTFLAF